MLRIPRHGASEIDILYVIYYMSLNLDMYSIIKLTKLPKDQVYRIHTAILKLITELESHHHMSIGGANKIVEIDESFIGKRKNNRGRIGNQKIIFGGIYRDDKKFDMRIVANRTRNELGNAITDMIVPGSDVYSDMLRSYAAFFNDSDQYNSHHTVNHTYNFVNPEDGTHTQNIESLWSSFKRFRRRKSYSKIGLLQDYIAEFKFRERGQKTDKEIFIQLMLLCFAE